MAYGVYTYRQQITGLAVAKSVIYLQVPTGYQMRVLQAWLTNRSVTTAEQLAVALLKIPAAGIGTPLGTDISALAEPSLDGDAASPITVALGNLTAEPTSPDATPIDEQGTPNTLGYMYWDDDRGSNLIAAGNAVALKLLANPVTSFNASCVMRVKLWA